MGWEFLSKGQHLLSFVCVGKDPRSSNYGLGIDTILVSKVASFPALESLLPFALHRIGEEGMANVNNFRQMTDALRNPSASVREAVAWALTQMEGKSIRGILELLVALDDVDPVVRGLAALALRNGSKVSEPALQKLIEQLKDDNPNVRLMAAQCMHWPAGESSDCRTASTDLRLSS